MAYGSGHAALWGWFGCSYASFAVMPRILMHDMPDEWQGRMAKLLEEFDNAFPNARINTRVLKVDDGRLVKWPEWILNYRYPDAAKLAALRGDAAGVV